MKYIQMSVCYTLGYYAYLFVVLHLIINVQLLNTVEWISDASYVAKFKKLTSLLYYKIRERETHTHTHTLYE